MCVCSAHNLSTAMLLGNASFTVDNLESLCIPDGCVEEEHSLCECDHKCLISCLGEAMGLCQLDKSSSLCFSNEKDAAVIFRASQNVPLLSQQTEDEIAGCVRSGSVFNRTVPPSGSSNRYPSANIDYTITHPTGSKMNTK